MTPKQKKIASKAPPRNKIDGKDFAVLRQEKAKGRGMGLQDEKMKPGKIMRADKGKMIKQDPTKAVNPFAKRAVEAAKATKYGKIAAGVAAAALATAAVAACSLPKVPCATSGRYESTFSADFAKSISLILSLISDGD